MLYYRSSIHFILKEVKLRTIWIAFSFFITAVTCFWFSDEFFFGLATPFFKVSKNSFFICTQITESLATYILISIVLGFFFCIPYLFYQMWCFFIPSLYQHQRFHIWQMLLFTSVILVFTQIWTFNWILPNIWSFLYQLSNTTPESEMFVIKLQPKIYDFSLLTLHIFSIMTICSQIPLLVLYSIQSGILSRKTLLKSRRTYAFISVLFAALISPPDFWCQLSVFLVILFFIELTLFYSIIQNLNFWASSSGSQQSALIGQNRVP